MLRERGKPPVAYMVDADRNYVGGAFISGLNREMRERLWEQGSVEMEALAAELVRLHQTGLIEEEELLKALDRPKPGR